MSPGGGAGAAAAAAAAATATMTAYGHIAKKLEGIEALIFALKVQYRNFSCGVEEPFVGTHAFFVQAART